MTVDVRIDVHLTGEDLAAQLRSDVHTGLSKRPRRLPPKWFYDPRGSELFERITRLPEYYPTRTERAILAEGAAGVAEISGAKTLVELGSGSSEKTRLLLDALRAQGTLARFVPLDVSEAALREATTRIGTDYPGLEVHGLVADFTRHLDRIPNGDGRLIAFLGGTIGNLEPGERARFFGELRAALHDGERLLLGADLVKDTGTLVAAYDDAAGVTAEFNRNVLSVLNTRLGADFDPGAFEHVARWDPRNAWIEMLLRSTKTQTATIPELDMTVAFEEGEELRTEISAKFTVTGLAEELAAAGFAHEHTWTDPADAFALLLARAA
ncbi:L-histidine N(alpha)-methyltransferase [Phytomonospora endophytica]|uniref:Histidine N-alpha-methyltransferase n=1 Tax=Phytomonospora endophytica TaxID=714109 RepID=A0A841F8W5_9ACTN|nr:L-histidine N(alpha)-methyltransferase [Phytomonospora endophytica]MBB6033561.1 L-histidine N-alpha-methyltransferase [Phytomonospora endophytica]GIG64922.1 histidine N-alpha-methyltransferase [Phytomonospora endophytica]